MKSDLPLATKTIKELQVLARKAGIVGWHDLRKSDLIEAIQRESAATGSAKAKSQVKSKPKEKAKEKEKTSVRGASSKSVAKKSKSPAEPVRRKASVTPVSSAPAVEGKRHPVRKKAPEKTPVSPKKSAPPVKDKSDTKTKGPVLKEKTPPKSQAPVRKKASSPDTTGTVSVQTPVKKVPVPPAKKKTTTPVVKKDQKTHVKADNQNTAPAVEKAQPQTTPAQPAPTEVQKNISALKEKLLLHKTLGTDAATMDREPRNQLILMVRDPFWLHAYWEMNMQLIDRIRAAMGHLWHTADPVLRLYRMHTDAGGTLRKEYLSDIRIHGGINNWYIDVDDPPSSFLVEIGYLARDGQFFILLSSNIVETPQRYVHDSFGHPDASWTAAPADFQLGNYQENGGDLLSGNGVNLDGTSRSSVARTGTSTSGWCDLQADFGLKIDAELVIKGETTPHVQVAIKGENIRLKEDGTFSIRYHLPERRHVFPIAAVSPDGVETKTIILAVERNTKILETVVRDEDDE